MKKRTKKRFVIVFLIVSVFLVISEFLFPLPSAFPAEIFPTIKEREIVQMLDKKIFQIFEKHPERFFGNSATDPDGDDDGNKSEIYFLIGDGLLLPGEYYVLADQSIVYWTKSGDTFLEILLSVREFQGIKERISKKEIEKEAGRQGLKSLDKLDVNDILVFKKEIR